MALTFYKSKSVNKQFKYSLCSFQVTLNLAPVLLMSAPYFNCDSEARQVCYTS